MRRRIWTTLRKDIVDIRTAVAIRIALDCDFDVVRPRAWRRDIGQASRACFFLVADYDIMIIL